MPEEFLFPPLSDDALLRRLSDGISDSVGEEFFRALVHNLAESLGTFCALVTTFEPETRTARSLAFWTQEGWIEKYEYLIDGTPCSNVFDKLNLFHYPDDLGNLFPEDHDIPKMGFVSYLGVPLLHTDGSVMGNLAVMDRKTMPKEPRFVSVFKLFAARAAAEHQRLKTEVAVQERERKLSRLIDGAMDAIIELNASLSIIQFNRAAERIFGCSAKNTIGCNFADLLERDAGESFKNLINDLDRRRDAGTSVWIPGGLNARRGDGSSFVAEATVSRLDTTGGHYFTIVLRNIEDRIRAAAHIHELREEAKVLKKEIANLRSGVEVIGESPVFRKVLREIDRVGPTHATVLLSGETGVGKEVVARSIHNASQRNREVLVCVNCAAVPANLIESEFFGHEKGAFTGATDRREGRFAMADGGSLFLDEIGELPLDLQSKLLRILQEGTFEPVGGSKTRHVDVRVIAATNRDLADEVKAGRFREDLFYRLNVFPIKLPPLRERGKDVLLLAENCARQLSRSMARTYDGLTDECEKRLLAHSWPGNIRELRNVIERALITSAGGRLNLPAALPLPELEVRVDSVTADPTQLTRVLTVGEMREFERQNIIRALNASDWKVSGTNGAANLLGIQPSTLSSRIKALGIERQ